MSTGLVTSVTTAMGGGGVGWGGGEAYAIVPSIFFIILALHYSVLSPSHYDLAPTAP